MKAFVVRQGIIFFDASEPLNAAQINGLVDLALKTPGCKRVVLIRYFDRFAAWKNLTDAECVMFEQADMVLRKLGGYFLLGIVYENVAGPRGSAAGVADGNYTRMRLAQIGAPVGAWVAAASDEDWAGTAGENLLADYFKAFWSRLSDGKGGYVVLRAIYAAGATLDLMWKLGLIDLGGRWVTQSTGFQGSTHDIQIGAVDVQQLLNEALVGKDVDPDVFHPRMLADGKTPEDWGFFVPRIDHGVLPDYVLPGSPATVVMQLQKLLNNDKRITGVFMPLTVDGNYGPKTTAAVKALQTAAGLEVDGLFWPKTKAVLLAGPAVAGGGIVGAPLVSPVPPGAQA